MFRFTDASVYWALHVLSDGKRVGRKRLSEAIGVGEGSMRRILNILREWDMICIKQTGITITKTGQEFLEDIPIRIFELDPGDLVLGSYVQAVVVKGAAEKVGNGLRQRDAGIRAGALGCTTLILTDGKIILPPEWSVDENMPVVSEQIRNADIAVDGDAVIIGGADEHMVAINAALNAAFELL